MRSARTILWLAIVAALCAAGMAAAAGPKPLRIAFPSEDGSLTPYTFETGYPLMMLVYDALMWRDAAGTARPWLASSVRRGAGGRSVTVRLRSGVRWHDGRPFSAADVVFTYRHMAARAHPRFTPQLRDIESVTAPDARTVVFTLRRASLGFEDQPLADVPILPRHRWTALSAEQRAPAGLPVGTGPYRLTRHVTGERYEFRANRRYFKGAPSVAAIDVPIVRQEDDAFSRLTQGSLDAAPVNVPPGENADRSQRLEFAGGTSYTGTMLAFNLAARPFDVLFARRAVAEAIDLDAIAGISTGPGALVGAERGMLHPASRWAPDRVLHRANQTAARVALTEGGVEAFTVLASSGDGVRLEAARRVVRALRRAGAQVRLQTVTPDDFERRLGRGGGVADFEAAVVGIPALASYDPSYLRNVFGDPQTATLNDGGYRSPRFEQLADRVGSATTPAARRSAVAEELGLLARDLPALPLFFGGTTFAYRAIGYDDWVNVAGTGILDKQSFLAPERGAQPPAATATDPRDTAGGGGDLSLMPFIAGLGVLLVGLVAWRLRRPRDPMSP
ncbi:MAG: ABC transporter substrate-binding protein [Solirubrobacteraceae bacterium]|nr:ABC transporter substrate-binding protein [Solirubrobacteraceae bacterium]